MDFGRTYPLHTRYFVPLTFHVCSPAENEVLDSMMNSEMKSEIHTQSDGDSHS